MNSRERLQATLNHKAVDRVCVDFGAGGQTGMGAGAVHRLRQAVLGASAHRVKVIEPYQMLGEIDEELRQALSLDVVGIHPRGNMFGFPNEGWKPFTMHDGTPVLVPEKFNWTVDARGGIEMYPQGDTGVPPSAVMPKGSFFFDATRRQEPFDDEHPRLEDNCAEFGLFGKEDVDHFVNSIKPVYDRTRYGIYMTFPGSGFGDIALVPATWMKRTPGIRDLEEWYVSTITRKDFIYKIFEQQCALALQNIETLARAVGDMPQVVFVSGTDFGTQRGLFASVAAYRDLFKPFHQQVNDRIHKLTTWKTFIHSCGAIRELIPDFIEAGFDVLNPVQCSAEGMDAKQLKQEFGRQLVFWGGGVDTQGTLPFGTPAEVSRQVRERIDIFNQDGGFVFNSVHNVQSNVPVENMLAMFKAIKDSGK
ncbi:MAG: methyltransferase [Kiritimatiellaeota bacterium]|nr:methyltransferase [Kiritimatiellota bacterium]